MKGYRLWCTDSKSHGFVTSKDVTFDTAGSVEESSKQVELENKASERVHNGTRVGPVDVAQVSTFNDGNPPLQQYNITTRREKRNIRPPQRFAHANTVVISLNTIVIEIPKSFSYTETGGSKVDCCYN